MADVPTAGKTLTIDDVNTLIDAINLRQVNFPDEPLAMTIMMILLNIGDRYAPIYCTVCEWSGIKQDLQGGTGIPTCPLGHPLIQGPGLQLGWISE